MEAAVRWSTLATHDQPRFLLADVAGNALTLYGITSQDKSSISYEPLAQRDKVPNFTAFDWSKTDDSLVALGLSSGEASLVKIEPGQAQTEPLRIFSIKTQRKCNSITFNSQNLLAVGLDRVRHDHCLTVYDPSGTDFHTRLCVSEAVSSVRFFPSRPQELLAAVQRQTIRLYDLRDPSTSTAGAGNVGITKLVNNIAIDPLDENYFASGGSTGDPSVTIWDKRYLSRTTSAANIDASANTAVLELRPAVDNTQTTSVWSIRYSALKRGRLCLLSSTGELKLYDTAHYDVSNGTTAQTPSNGPPPQNPYGGNPWSAFHYVAKTHRLRAPRPEVRAKSDNTDRVISFDWLSSGHRDGQAMLALHPDRKVELLYAPHPCHLNMTGNDDLALCREHVSICQPTAKFQNIADDIIALNNSRSTQSSPKLEDTSAPDGSQNRPSTLDQRNLKALNPAASSAAARTEQWLENDVGIVPKIVRNEHFADFLMLSSVPRRRCQEGYLFDPLRNVEIVAEDTTLVKLWTVIGRLDERAKEGGMVSDGLDLSYLGVKSIWEGSIGSGNNRTVVTRAPKPATLEEAVRGVLETHDIPDFQGPQTGRSDQRQLCLALCGWSFFLDDAKERCEQLRAEQQYYKAIVTAMFHGYKRLALEMLRDLIREGALQNIGLGALMAADKLNFEQRQMCAWMEEDATDPYLQAILVYLRSNDWNNVVTKPDLALDLSDRVGIAFRHLSDAQLTPFVRHLTQSCIVQGDVEGVLLTGLAEESMDLFQAYMTRTNDLQTAVLATALTNPLYVDDVRWDMWKQTYFMQMQTWRAFIERTKFSMQHTRRSVTHSKQKLITPPPRQLTLRCAHCQGSLAKRIDGASAETKQDTNRTRIMGPAASAGTVCPRCGRHLPRCSLCMQWLGTPEPTKAKEVNGDRETDLLSKFVTFCATCTHGFHAHHARTWFAKHAMCPVPDCRCLCGLRV